MTNPSTSPVLQRAVRLGTSSARLGPFVTMRGAASAPLGPSITMRGAASAPLRWRSGPLLQCAPRHRFGTARALYYNARCRHPVYVLQSFNSVGVMNFQENTKTNRNPQNATLTLKSRRFFKRGAPHLRQGIPSILRAQPFLTKAWAWLWPLMCPMLNCISGEFVAFILVSKNTSKTGLATEGLSSKCSQGVENMFFLCTGGGAMCAERHKSP